MTWVRFDDASAFNAKVMAAGNEAVGAWFRATCWCSQQLTDGRLPLHVARGIAVDGVWVAAIEMGLIDVDLDGSYRIHDYLEYNMSADEVRALRNKKAAAGAAGWRARVLAPVLAPAQASALADGLHNNGRGEERISSGSGSESEKEIHAVTGKKAKRSQAARAAIVAEWDLTEANMAYALARGFTPERARFEAERFKAHHQREGTLSASWAASWNSWVLNDQKFASEPRGAGNAHSRAASPFQKQLEHIRRLEDEERKRGV